MQDSKKKLKIMIYSVEGVGHVNACIGLAEKLKNRGHNVVFLVEKVCQQLLDGYGFDVVLLDIAEKYPKIKTENKDSNEKAKAVSESNNPGEEIAKFRKATGLIDKGNSYEKYQRLIDIMKFNKEKMLYSEKVFKEIFEAQKPDVYILDSMFISPTIFYSGTPWVRIVSPTPFFYDNVSEIPPGGSGYPLNGDKTEWPKFRELPRKFFSSKEYNEMIVELGFEPYPNDEIMPSNYALSIYGYPEELSYKDVFQYPDNWVNVETFMRESKGEKFEMPESLNNVRDKYPGKLILLSLGSMCSVDIDLMKRFVDILSKTKHRYIVSKGARHTEFELAENMWGDRYIPQTKILPIVDLVIAHGGNNTFTETLANGKPTIIFPMYADQFDNAQRIEEVGFGRRFDPHDFDEDKLTEAIDQLLNDVEVNERLRIMSKRILNGDRFENACKRIEALVS